MVKFFSPVLPEIELPTENISLDEKVIFTIGSGLVFILSQIPIYGLVKDAPLKMSDPFVALRPLFAMEQGSLLEIGLLPILTAAFAWQIAAGLKLIKVNLTYAQDRELFQSAQKLTAIFLSGAFAVALIASGYYDSVIRGFSTDASNLGSYGLIFLQVFGWNVILTLLVEVIDKGYGFGSGVLCFVTLNAATGLVRDVVGLELVSATADGEPQTYGVIAYLVKSLFTMELSTIKAAFVGIFTRSDFPNIFSVLIVLGTGLATIILQNFRVELPVRSNKARGTSNVYPIRLLYTGALPVLFAFTALANIQVLLYFVSVATEPFYPTVSSVVSAIAFYFSPPASFTASVLSPVRAVVYCGSVIVLATAFAQFWSLISGSAPKDIAKQFKDQSIIIAGKREVSVTKELSRTVPVASVAGAFALAALALAGELIGASGKTVSVSIGVCAAFAILEEFMMEFQQSGSGSQFMNSLAGAQ